MTVPPVGALYDALLTFEAKRRGAGAYPVHKRLRLAESHEGDVYDWLADRLALASTDRVLDVGCGVGFGTIRLAERGVAQAVGITISPAEMARASRTAAESPRASAIEFRAASFDRLPPESFDVIVAVESLKHSSDITATLREMRAALVPGGRLAIVEDLFTGDPTHPSARRVVSDWLLPRLLGADDYLCVLGPERSDVVDLTAGVAHGGRVRLALQLSAVNLALALSTGQRAAALRAFRGGLHLERLYAVGAMRYAAIFFTKADAR